MSLLKNEADAEDNVQETFITLIKSYDIIEKTLSDEVRRTLILYYFDEMTTKEIAS